MPYNLHLSYDVHSQRFNNNRESGKGDLERRDGGEKHTESDSVDRFRYDFFQGCYFSFSENCIGNLTKFLFFLFHIEFSFRRQIYKLDSFLQLTLITTQLWTKMFQL
jgi:hypothetical protein